ncbi:MAG TPA: glycosyltransferase [Nitrososphaeraceae archaeon]|nr:glycosyltransferase [Nitrososphaeraceae archaeon]
MTSDEIPVLLGNSLFEVLPYTCALKYSVSGIIPLAYTFSKPVIVSDVNTLTKYVEYGKTAFIFDVDYAEQLANYVKQLYEDERLYAEMGIRTNQKPVIKCHRNCAVE